MTLGSKRGGPGGKNSKHGDQKGHKGLEKHEKRSFSTGMPLKSVLEGGQNGPKIPEKKCFFCRLAN